MTKRKQIKAIFMLLVMLTMMTHNVFPHVHHKHTSDIVAFTSSDLHHDRHHDHHNHGHEHKNDSQPEESEKTNLLDFLFEGHAHSSHSHQYTPAPTFDFRAFNELVSNDFQSAEIHQIDFGERREESKKYSDFQRRYPPSVYLCSNPLRGPPTLV
jgi:hypothetical protein